MGNFNNDFDAEAEKLAAALLLLNLGALESKLKECSKKGEEKPSPSIEKEKALTEELLKKDEKIKFLYKTISERDEQIAKLKKEIEHLKIMTAPPVISKEDIRRQKEDERYKKLEEQIAALRRQVEKDNNPLNYWKYASGDENMALLNKGGTFTASDSAVK